MCISGGGRGGACFVAPDLSYEESEPENQDENDEWDGEKKKRRDYVPDLDDVAFYIFLFYHIGGVTPFCRTAVVEASLKPLLERVLYIYVCVQEYSNKKCRYS